jgi:hypothetical protein
MPVVKATPGSPRCGPARLAIRNEANGLSAGPG